MKKNRGFTLIEIMIVVAVIGILAAIAYPAFTSQMRKSSRAAVQAVMMDIANKEIFYLQSNRTYTTDYATDLAITPPDDVNTFYTITISKDDTATPPTFFIQAAPKAGTRQVPDGNLTLNSAGTKTPPDKW